MIVALIPAGNAVDVLTSAIPGMEAALEALLGGRRSIVWLVGVITVLIWLCRVLVADRVVRIPKTILVCITVWVSMAAASLLWSPDQVAGLRSFYGMVDELVFFVLVLNLVRTRRHVDVLLMVFLFAVTAASLFTLRNTWDLGLARGTLADDVNANAVSYILVTPLLSCPYLLGRTRGLWKRLIVFLAAAVILLALLATGSIACLGALLASFALGAIIIAPRRVLRLAAPAAATVAGLAFAAFLGAQAGLVPDVARSRLEAALWFTSPSSEEVGRLREDEPELWGERWLLWSGGMEVAALNPFVGLGIGQYSIGYTRVKEIGVLRDHNPHSNYVTLIAELGIVGLGAFVCLLLIILKRLLPNRHETLVLTGIMLLAVSVLIGAAHPTLQQDILWLNLGLATAIPAILYRESRSAIRAIHDESSVGSPV